MTTQTRLVREGSYVAEVDIELIESDHDWAPYVSVEDAGKLYDVRMLLKDGKLKEAAKLGRIFQLTPVATGA